MRKNREANPPRSRDEALGRILKYSEYIERQIEKFGNDLEIFSENELFRDTCCMKLSYIGDIIKFLPDSLKALDNEIPWEGLENARDFIAHEYLVIEHEDVWLTITEDIPKLSKFCRETIAKGGLKN